MPKTPAYCQADSIDGSHHTQNAEVSKVVSKVEIALDEADEATFYSVGSVGHDGLDDNDVHTDMEDDTCQGIVSELNKRAEEAKENA